MLDIKYIREHSTAVEKRLGHKKVHISLDHLLKLDDERRRLITQADEWRARQNEASAQIGQLMKSNQDASSQMNAVKELKKQMEGLEPQIKRLEEEIHDILIALPNLPHESVPVGGAEANTIVSSWGDLPRFDFQPKDHIELAEHLDIIDFKRAVKLSGSNFILYKGLGARLERALINFMLDLHTTEHGYQEIFPPVLVNSASMTGTGQLPKLKDDMYRVEGEDLYLIPTAEVPVTNIHRAETLNEDDLPVMYAAYSSCFRKEAGSYGKDTRGLVRVHQFNKVEMVKFVKPDHSYEELQRLLRNAQTVFERLEIPYRTLELATGDLSFAAAKCFDIEVYAAGSGKWLEASSCSNFEDFQARRSGIRYKNKSAKRTDYVHTLNGSGVALPRTMIAILENYQTRDGTVRIPEPLRAYMGGVSEITP